MSTSPKQPQDRRINSRKDTLPIEVTVLLLDNLVKLARSSWLIQASASGLLLRVERKDIVPNYLRQSLCLDSVVGQQVLLHIRPMELELGGQIARTRFLGKDGFEIGIDYSDEAPEYWRECLMDVLPPPEGFSEIGAVKK